LRCSPGRFCRGRTMRPPFSRARVCSPSLGSTGLLSAANSVLDAVTNRFHVSHGIGSACHFHYSLRDCDRISVCDQPLLRIYPHSADFCSPSRCMAIQSAGLARSCWCRRNVPILVCSGARRADAKAFPFSTCIRHKRTSRFGGLERRGFSSFSGKRLFSSGR
jgi:hypothetical protein